MRQHLATLLEDFRRNSRDIAVVRYQGNRRRVTTYAQLAQMAARFARLLEQNGIGTGDRVLIWGENSAEWLAAFHGCMMRGVVSVPIDAAGTAEFANRVATDVKPKLAVGDALLIDSLDPEIPRLNFEDWPSALPAEEAQTVPGLNHDTPLQILFTSGTTGDPKGVVITHGNVLASVGPIEEGSQKYLRCERLIHPMRILHTLPLSHVYGQTMGLWIPQIYRAELHFESRLAAPRLIELIKRERISVLAAVPRVLALLKAELESNHPGLTDEIAAAAKRMAWLRWLRFRKIHSKFGWKFWAFVSGGGALPAALEQFWNTLGFVLVQGYGMTETTALITLNHPFHVAKGTIGKPLAGREVKLGADGEVLVRGAMISRFTWSGGKMRAREGDWLSTGDIAESTETGELKFLGRKSEVIVTSNGLNLYPEDIEAAIEAQPGIAACAVVALETDAGPEPCAVVSVRGAGDDTADAIERANATLAEFQRIRRWTLYAEPDLPRTSTGKVKRREVAAWLNHRQRASSAGDAHAAFGAHADWLLALIAEIGGERTPGVGDELRLSEDLHLDSLGRVQLAAAIEERLGIVSASGLLDGVETLGQLRKLVAGEAEEHEFPSATPIEAPVEPSEARATTSQPFTAGQLIYPTWQWSRPVRWIRNAFIEAVMRPLVWLLGAPRVERAANLPFTEPVLIVANHVSTYDGPLIQYALPGPIRRAIAAAMSAEMLEDFRHWRNPEKKGFSLWGKPTYLFLTALFNVFPLPRRRDFQASFVHAGRALDRGYNVLVFPEGTRSAEGELARFRSGIGVLVKHSHAAVLPVGLCGLGEIKTGNRRWFRSGAIEVRVGELIRFAPQVSEAEIAERLHEAVATLLEPDSGVSSE